MEKKKIKMDKNVILTGFTSFFTDISSEMVYPLLQGFVAVVLKTQAVFLGPVLGIIEGIAESTASLLKVFSGYFSDKMQKRKLPAIAGYTLSSFAKLLYFIPSWFSILMARFFDRVGKGIRTAPRDALISESTPKEIRGRAFGLQRAMDFAGAFIGTLLCYIIIKYIFPSVDKMDNVKDFFPIFAVSIVPAFIGVIFLFFVAEKKKQGPDKSQNEKPRPNLDIRKYDKNLQVLFLVQFIFTLGNSSNQFLLLRSVNLGFVLSTVLIMYIIFNLSSTLLSSVFGTLSDKIGRKNVLVMGYTIYAIVYIAFGFISKETAFLLWIFWPVYGIYYAMSEGVEKAFVSDISPGESRATALGFYNTILGIGLLPASVIAGFLYQWHPAYPYIFGGIMAFIAVFVLFFFVKEKQPAGSK